jgi:hypothetical protein
MHKRLRKFLSTALTMCALVFVSSLALAHDIPGRVAVFAFVKPENERLIVLARVPMESLTEIQFPIRGLGYLDLERAGPALDDAAKLYVLEALKFYAEGRELAAGTLVRARIAYAADKSFTDYTTARALIESPPIPATEDLYWKQGWLDIELTFPITNPHAHFAMAAEFQRLGTQTHTALHFLPPDSPERVFTYIGSPGLIELDPSFWHAVSRFVALGFEHILEGVDHLLFLFCLVVVARNVLGLIPVITSFTVAHSITLISSAFGLTPTALWFPPLIETLIAVSVLYMACENIVGAKTNLRWVIVFCFGLVHGFGFSFILADRMQFAGPHLLSALLAFNVGVELGQLAVLLITVPILSWLFRRLPSERIGVILLSAFAAHTAWHWFTERGEQLLAYQWQWPTFDAAFFAAAMRWAILFVGSGAVLWGLNELFSKLRLRSART